MTNTETRDDEAVRLERRDRLEIMALRALEAAAEAQLALQVALEGSDLEIMLACASEAHECRLVADALAAKLAEAER